MYTTSNKFDKNSRTNLVEDIIFEAIQQAFYDIDENLYAHLECRYNWLGDTDEAYNPYTKQKVDLLSDLKEYTIPLNKCSYKEIYKFIENIIKDGLYNRKDNDANMPIVWFHSCNLGDTNIMFRMSITLLNKLDEEESTGLYSRE